MTTELTFYSYAAALLIFPLGCFTLIILQLLSDHSSSFRSKVSDRYTKILLYAVYISGCCCGSIGFSLHIATNTVWCERYGLIPCFTLLGASKAFLYLFFLRRAKLAQGMITNNKLLIFFKYIGPIYLFFYWTLYCILTTIVFSGKYVEHNSFISNCIFGKWAIWFCIFAGCIDVFNSISSLSLFFYPLIRAMNEAKTVDALGGKQKSINHLGYVSVMRWNLILTSIASLSSITTLFMITVANHYIWLFCLGDPFINGMCTFFMIASNRQFIAKIFTPNDNNVNEAITRIRNFTLSNYNQNKKETEEKQKNKNNNDQTEDKENKSNISSEKLPNPLTLETVTTKSDGSTPNAESPPFDPLSLSIANSNRVPALFLAAVDHRNENVSTEIIFSENKANDK